MGSELSARSIISVAVLSCGLTLAACTSAPPKLGQSIAEIKAIQDETFRRPEFAFQSDLHRFALYHDYGTMYVFEDDRYLCWLSPNVVADFSACLAQPDGLELLASRYQSLCSGGFNDPLMQLAPNEMATVGDLRCPSVPVGSPLTVETKDEQGKSMSMGEVAGGITYGVAQTAAVAAIPGVIALVLIPSAIAYSGVRHVQDHPSLVAQEKLQLGMSAANVSQLMGTPTARLFLEPAHVEVWYFDRSEPNNELWIAFVDNQLMWLRYTTWYDTNWQYDWLTAFTTRSLKAAAITP